MRDRVLAIVGVVLVLAFAGLIGWAVVRGVEAEPSVVGSFATALGAILAVLVQRDRENKREVERTHREQLAPIYEELFEHFNNGTDFSSSESQAFMSSLHRKLLFYGSDAVVAQWLAWLREWPEAEQRDDDDPTTLLAWERVLFGIRHDLGHKNANLRSGDLLRIYINDIDAHIASWERR